MPDDPLLYAHQVAEQIGVTVGTWRGYVSRGQAPPPDDQVIDGSHVRPQWRRSVIQAWMDGRPGRGVRQKDEPVSDIGAVSYGPLRLDDRGATCNNCGAIVMPRGLVDLVQPLVGLLISEDNGVATVRCTPGAQATLYGAREDGLMHQCGVAKETSA